MKRLKRNMSTQSYGVDRFFEYAFDIHFLKKITHHRGRSLGKIFDVEKVPHIK